MNIKKTTTAPFSNSEISAFCGQMALILKSGISSIEGISIMLEDASGNSEKAILQIMYEKLMETGSFHSAICETKLFPSYMLKMVEIGEQTGTLDEVMEHLREHYEREHSIAKSIQNAVTYPLIMTAMLIVVITVLLVKVMPVFNQVFIQLGTEMTGFSKGLMQIGNTINQYSIVFIILFVLICAFLIFIVKTHTGKIFLNKFTYKIPSLRSVHESNLACRFASGMALTLSSGLDIEQSLRLAGALNNDSVFQNKIDTCFKLIDEGENFYTAIHNAGIFSGVYARMVSLGSKTGTMDKVMDNIAQLYQDELDERINNILAVLEPTLVILLSLIVGVILLSVMLPLIGIMSAI